MKLIFAVSFQVLFLITNLCSQSLNGQFIENSLDDEPELYPSWTFWVPGATHFYDGGITGGIIFSGLETGLITTGILYEKRLKSHSNSPYYNYPLFLGINLFGIDKIDFAMRNLADMKFHNPGFSYDPVSFNNLLKEPFRYRNILTPITGSFMALALLQLYIESRNAEYSIRKVNEIYFMDGFIPKETALPLYALVSAGMSWEAGIGEEYWIRNYLMPVLDYRMGKRKGLLLTSGIFGGLHGMNYLFIRDRYGNIYEIK